MYSIEKELKILRQFVKLEHMDNAEGWRCYSEDELTAAEERLRAKLPLPIREIYLYMADLLISSNYLRPLELDSMSTGIKTIWLFLRIPMRIKLLESNEMIPPMTYMSGRKLIRRILPGSTRMILETPMRSRTKRVRKRRRADFRNTGKSSMRIRNTVLCGLRNGRMNRGTTVL